MVIQKTSKRKVLAIVTFVCLSTMGMSAWAKTTHPVYEVVSGDWNPFTHDHATAYVKYCTEHSYRHSTCFLPYSKVMMRLTIKGNGKSQTVQYNSGSIKENREFAYCDKNDNKSPTITAISPVSDKYKVKAKVKTRDCGCLECIEEGVPGDTAYVNWDSVWKSE